MSNQRSTLLPKTATMSNGFCVEISSFRQSRTLLRQCCPKRQHCRFDNVASTLLLVWTGLYRQIVTSAVPRDLTEASGGGAKRLMQMVHRPHNAGAQRATAAASDLTRLCHGVAIVRHRRKNRRRSAMVPRLRFTHERTASIIPLTGATRADLAAKYTAELDTHKTNTTVVSNISKSNQIH